VPKTPGCEPQGFRADSANAVARAQIAQIDDSRGGLPEVTEVDSKSEAYGW